jgi:hypothetical protein
VTLDGEDATLAPGTLRRVASRLGARHVVARTTSGATLEDLRVDDPADGSFVLYNALGAAPILVEVVVYAERPGEIPPPEDLAGASWTVARRVEHPFEDVPARLEVRGRRAERRHAVLLDDGWRTAVEGALDRGDARRAADLAARVALAQGDEPALHWAGNVLVGADPAAALRFGEEAAARHPSSVQAHRVLQTAMERLGRGDEALARYRAAHERDPASPRAAYLHARLLPAARALPLLERGVADHPTDSWLRLALGWVHFAGRRFEAAIPHFERVRAEVVGAEGLPLDLHARALAATGRTPEAQRLVLERIGPGTWANLVLYDKLRRLPDADRSLRPGGDLVDRLAVRGLTPAQGRLLLASLSRDPAAFARHAPAIEDAAFPEGLRIALLSATDVDAAAEAAALASPAARGALDAVAAVTVGCELLRRDRADLAEEVHAAGLASLGADLPFAALASPETAAADEDLDFEVRAALLVAAARRATDPAERDRLLALARAHDVLRCVVP